MTTIPPAPVQTWWQKIGNEVKTYGLAHWTYILTAVVANLIGVIFHF